MENILIGVAQVIQPLNLLMVFSGVLLGLIIGAVPGLTTNMAIAIMVPVTYSMEPAAALIFLVSIYCAGMYGGSIAAILLGIPGSGGAVATTVDGHPLAAKGRAGYAMFVATVSSVFGGLVSSVVLLVAAPQLARLAVRFGPGEFLALGIFGIVTVASLSGSKSVIRGLIAGVFGLLLSVVGLSPLMGAPRFTFGRYEIIDGFPLVPVFIGLFGLGSILQATASDKSGTKAIVQSIGKMLHPLKDLLKYWRTFIRSSAIGVFLGLIPGPGAVAASFMAHDRAKRASKTPENFGKGEPEGVVATETANNSVVGSSLVPLLALGVPGNAIAALFLGALLLHGLRPGPALFRGTPEVAYGLVIAMFLANIVMAPFGLLVGRGFSYFLKVPAGIMRAVIMAICMVGTYSLRNNIGDMYIMIGFGLLSHFMRKLDVPSSPVVLGIILGPLIEKSYHQAMTIFDGNPSFLVTRPITLALILLSVWSLVRGIMKSVPRKEKGAKNTRQTEKAKEDSHA